MPTTVLSQIERVSDLLSNYGTKSTQLAAAVTTTSETSFSVDDQSTAKAGDWAVVDGETVEVVAATEGSPDTFTVRRGMRGSTAATHLDNAVIRINPDFQTQRILNALQLAQDAAYPQLCSVVSDVTLSVVANQWDYATPSAVDDVRQIWVETSTSGVYSREYRYRMVTADIIHLDQTFTSGRTIKVVGTKRFSALTYAGNLDTAFPVSDTCSLGYLVYEAAAELVSEQQLQVSKRDGFKGMTDAFAQGAPTISLATGERYREIAQRYLRDATRNLVLPEETIPTMLRF